MNLPATNIDVLKYQESLKNWLRQYPQFTDFDFEGSNFSVLLSLLAYNAYNMAHYDNMVGNEAWIDTAELRQSLVSHATDLNYLPRSKISASSIIEVEVFPDDNPVNIILPKYYKFKTTDVRGNTLYFVTDQDYITTKNNQGRYIFKDVIVYQGDIVREYFDVTGVINDGVYVKYTEPFIISSSNIDINSLEVYVKESSSDSHPQKYTYAKTLASTTNISNTFFLRGIYDDQYAIEFGDGTFGSAISNGNQVLAVYRNTLGQIAQGNYVLTKTTDIAGYNSIVINSATRVQGGFDRESVEELRVNAPRHFQTQDRAVTEYDYQAIIKEYFPHIQQVYVFGGELVEQYGKVMIVLKPFGTTGVVSNQVKKQIVSTLKSKNIVPEPIIINPSYYYIGLSGNVFYNGNTFQSTEDQLKTTIYTELTKLNNNEIGNFGVTVYQSLINDTIDKSDKSINGSDITMDLRYRWVPSMIPREKISFDSHNSFYRSRDGEYRNENDYAITSSIFQIFYNERVVDAVVRDDGIGNLFLYIIDKTGKISKVGQSIGMIDYDKGAIAANLTIVSYNGNYIQFTCRLHDKTLHAVRDSFLLLESNDISLDMKRM